MSLLKSIIREACAAGITLTYPLEKAVADAASQEKLLLVYFYEQAISQNNFLAVLGNTDINDLFKTDFTICITTPSELQPKFKKLIADDPKDMVNKLYAFGVLENDFSHITTLSVHDTPQEDILYELYEIHKSFKNYLHKSYVRTVEENASHYFLMNRHWLVHKYVPLETALHTAMNDPVPYLRKMIMIYMCKRGSKLTSLFDCIFKSGKLNKYMTTLVIPIFWDITDDKYHKATRMICQHYFDHELLADTVDSEEGGVFLFMPDDNSIISKPTIFTRITSPDMYPNVKSCIQALENVFLTFQDNNQVSDLAEIEATYDVRKLPYLQGFDKYILHGSSLQHVIQTCLEDESPKLLLFYLHSPFSTLKNRLKSLLPSLFTQQVIFLPWDISNLRGNAELALSVRRAFGLKKIENIVKARKGALLIFVPYGKTLVLHSALDADVSESAVEKAFREAHAFFLQEIQVSNSEDRNSGPAAYQQVMCDQLADRAFDCFQLKKEGGVQKKLLREKIAFAYFGAPQKEDGTYDEKQEKQISTAYEKIHTEASQYGEDADTLYISFMRVCTTPLPGERATKMLEDKNYKPELDFSAFPLFGIRKCFDCPMGNTPCRIYVDHIGRTYVSWEDFLENNKYPQVMLIAPKNGRYAWDDRGNVQLEICPSPACGIGVAVLKGFDIGAAVVGVVAAVAGGVTSIVALPALGLVAVPVGIGVGVYGIVRSSMSIADRAKYGESLSFASSAARGAYLNIIVSSLGFTSAGATFAMAYAARTGANIGKAAQVVVNGITIVNIAAGATGVGNSAYEFFVDWREEGRTNTLAVVQLTTSLLFFGHAVYNVQFAGTIIENAQMSTIQGMLEALDSNRQRKTMLRLINTTIKNAGSVTAGNAEVIKYIQSIDNTKEVIATLTRNTKLMSKNGVKYSVQNQQIVFNGEAINVSEFASMSKIQRNDLLASIQSEPRVNTQQPKSAVTTTSKNYATLENAINVIRITAPVVNVVLNSDLTFTQKIKELFGHFSPYIQRELTIIVKKLLVTIGFPSNDLYKSLLDMYPRGEIISRLLEIVLSYYHEHVRKNLPAKVEPLVTIICSLIEKAIIISSLSMARLISCLIVFCSKWVANKIVERLQMNAAESAPVQKRATQPCSSCHGKFYKK